MTPAELSHLLAEATEGPWEIGMAEDQEAWILRVMRIPDAWSDEGISDQDAALIVALRNHGDALVALWEAAKELSRFLNEEKQTTSPPDALLSKDCVACESSADYEREEELAIALAAALARLEETPPGGNGMRTTLPGRVQS